MKILVRIVATIEHTALGLLMAGHTLALDAEHVAEAVAKGAEKLENDLIELDDNGGTAISDQPVEAPVDENAAQA